MPAIITQKHNKTKTSAAHIKKSSRTDNIAIVHTTTNPPIIQAQLHKNRATGTVDEKEEATDVASRFCRCVVKVIGREGHENSRKAYPICVKSVLHPNKKHQDYYHRPICKYTKRFLNQFSKKELLEFALHHTKKSRHPLVFDHHQSSPPPSKKKIVQMLHEYLNVK